MKVNLHAEPAKPKRLMIQLSEFSYEAYPVRIKQGFSCVLHAPRVRGTPKKSPRRGWVQQISNWLGRACGEPAAVQ